MAAATTLLAVRATVNLPWLAVGETMLVNPELTAVAAALEGQYIVPLDADQQPNTQEPISATEPADPTGRSHT